MILIGDNKPTTIIRTDIKERILTPEEGCGYSKAQNTRIVGGSAAKNGIDQFNVADLTNKFLINCFEIEI